MKCKDLTVEQKFAIIRILQLIMEADGFIHENEVDYFNNTLRDFNISESDIEIIASYDDVRCFHIISRMSVELKSYAVKLFKEMASCDGFEDPRELAIINKI